MMTRYGVLCTTAALLLLSQAWAAPQTDAQLVEIAAALSGNQAHKAEQMASAALAAPDLTGLQRGRLLFDRGLAYELQGAHAGALEDLTQAIDANVLPAPEQALALFERGMARDSLGRLDEALVDYTASLKLVPGSAPVLNNRANVARRLNRLDDAKRDYLASLAAGNSQPEYPYYGLGQIAEAEGDTEAARSHYAKAVAANPGYRLAADRLAALEDHKPAGHGDVAMADTGVIHLHPPAAKVPAVPPLPDPQAPARPGPVKQAAAAPRGDVSLRPAIMDRGAQRAAEAQLGSWRQESDASQAWARAMKRAGDDLAGLQPHIVPVDLPGRGRYYRLRVAASAGAAQLCASLTAKGLDCLPVRD